MAGGSAGSVRGEVPGCVSTVSGLLSHWLGEPASPGPTSESPRTEPAEISRCTSARDKRIWVPCERSLSLSRLACDPPRSSGVHLAARAPSDPPASPDTGWKTIKRVVSRHLGKLLNQWRTSDRDLAPTRPWNQTDAGVQRRRRLHGSAFDRPALARRLEVAGTHSDSGTLQLPA